MKILLESLRSFHSESSVEREILGMLVDIGILWRRNIRTQARKLTEKALEMAEKYENWELALAVLYWMQIVQPSEQGSIGYKDLSAVFQKQQDIAARLLAENQYSEFARLLSSYTGTGSFHADNQPDTIKELMANPLVQDENLAATVPAKQLFHHVHVIYNTYVLHDDAKAVYHSSRRFNTLNSAQHIVESKPKLFLYAAHQHAQRLLMNKYFDECAYILGRIKDLIRTNEEHYPAFAVDAVPLYLSLDVLFHINTARIAEGAKKVPQWQALYQKVGADLEENFQRAIPFNIALLLFLNHDYAQALRWVQIVTQCNDEYYPAIGTAARLMTLCIHVELGNESLLADYARSIQRYLQKQGAIHLPERAILAMFRATAAKELSDAELRSLLETLQNIPKNAKENSSLQLFDVELWLQSRLEGKSLVNLIKERFLS